MFLNKADDTAQILSLMVKYRDSNIFHMTIYLVNDLYSQ